MWLCGSTYFLSVVADRGNPDRLLVRARLKGHIEEVFPKAEVFTDQGADYFYRAWISREEVAEVLAEQVRGIGYDNFKASVPDQALEMAYIGVWRLMHKLQDSLREVGPCDD